ncbi:hypothetical protein, partial [Actinotignum sanguinis]
VNGGKEPVMQVKQILDSNGQALAIYAGSPITIRITPGGLILADVTLMLDSVEGTVLTSSPDPHPATTSEP